MTGQQSVNKLEAADSKSLPPELRQEIHMLIDGCKAGLANESVPEWLGDKITALLQRVKEGSKASAKA